jgi:vacuolar-type H+-ATPase subunit C/Vma6
MMRTASNDLDYLATRLHARRAQMAEAGRLDELCRLRTVPELGRAVFPGAEFIVAADFQRRLVQNLIQEMSGCAKHLDEEGLDLIAWLLTRFQLENVKVLLRGFLNHTPLEALQPHLVPLPEGLAFDEAGLVGAKSIEDFQARLPAGNPRNRLQATAAGQREPAQLFILEAALDGGYFQELLARTARLQDGEAEIVKPLSFQEANLFQFLLVARGKFHFGLTADTLLPLRLARSNDNDDWFNALLSAPDLMSVVKAGVGVVIDALPATPGSDDEPALASTVEALAWQRYLRLANSAFHRSHMGVGAVAGYFGVRRMEIANLMSLSEGIRLGVEEREIRSRMIPRLDTEASHV